MPPRAGSVVIPAAASPDSSGLRAVPWQSDLPFGGGCSLILTVPRKLLAVIALTGAGLGLMFFLIFWPAPDAMERPPLPPEESRPTMAPRPVPAAAERDNGHSPESGQAIGPTTAAEPAADWENTLDEILEMEADETTVARRLVAAMRGLPVEAQTEFLEHALNLYEDENFRELQEVYLNAQTSPEVVEVIFDDMLNRPEEVKLPLLAQTMRLPRHPMAEESREILEMYLDLDEGTSPPGGWEAAVSRYLRELEEE
jgi:hypothetical protein